MREAMAFNGLILLKKLMNHIKTTIFEELNFKKEDFKKRFNKSGEINKLDIFSQQQLFLKRSSNEHPRRRILYKKISNNFLFQL